MQLGGEIQQRHEDALVINKRFLKSTHFWIRVVIIACLTVALVNILQLDLTTKQSFGTGSAIKRLEKNDACSDRNEKLNEIIQINLGICLVAWATSIIYVAINLFNVHRFFEGFLFKAFVRLLRDKISAYFKFNLIYF